MKNEQTLDFDHLNNIYDEDKRQECKKRLKTPETFRKDVFDLVGNE